MTMIVIVSIRRSRHPPPPWIDHSTSSKLPAAGLADARQRSTTQNVPLSGTTEDPAELDHIPPGGDPSL